MAPLEPWEKVFINLGSKEFISELDWHLGPVGCDECHGGDPGEQDDPEAAHQGLIPDPSRIEHKACKQCHWNITESAEQSMHFQLWGEKKTLAARTGSADFDSCPAALKEGYLGECTSCHATCGDCHISQPDSVGKGFIKNHLFQAKPHQKNQCMACHGSRISFDFLGDDEAGRLPDIHFLKGKNCMSCHTGDQLHAAREYGADRYHLDDSPTCEGCHDVASANAYHQTHWDDLSCQVCHAQEYNNCAACHVDHEYQTDPVYQENSPDVQFRMGLNPFEDRRFKFVTLRHIPVSPESYDFWEGVLAPLDQFDALPTWKYTTPHSIRRWTPRTEVTEGGTCGSSCHLGAPGGPPENAQWYLWKNEVEQNWPLEADANDGVVVDGMLPDDWSNE